MRRTSWKALSTLFCIVLNSPLALTFAAVPTTSTYVLCRNNKTVRTIRLKPASDEDSCVTTYTKEGKDRVVGSGRYDSTCEKVMINIRVNLEGAMWTCKDISSAKISSADSSMQ